MTETPKPPVTQEAREAAARWEKNSRHHQAANILRGSCDTSPIVQAFAAFEAKIRADQRGRDAVISRSVFDDRPRLPAEMYYQDGWDDATKTAAQAIRNQEPTP